MRLIQLYCRYVLLFFKSSGEYKVSFYTGIFTNFYSYFITFALFWVLTMKFQTIGGWNFSEISLLYGFNLFTYAIAGTLFWNSIYFLENLITTGGLDRYLLRPIGVIPQLIFQGFGHTFIGQILVSLIFLVNSFVIVSPEITLFKIIYMIVTIVSTVLLQAGAIILVGSLSFWVLRSTDIGQIVYYDIRSFINYPLNIYPAYIKLGLTFVLPWGFINYYPSILLLGKEEHGIDYILGMLTPAVGVLFFLFSLYIFKRGLAKYESSGS